MTSGWNRLLTDVDRWPGCQSQRLAAHEDKLVQMVWYCRKSLIYSRKFYR